MRSRKLFALGLLLGSAVTNLVSMAVGYEPVPMVGCPLPVFPFLCFVAGFSIAEMIALTLRAPLTR